MRIIQPAKIRKISLCVVAAVAIVLPTLRALAHDIPNEIILQGYVKPEGQRLTFLVRIPLIMLSSINLPKRGPGYLDLAHIDKSLNTTTAVVAKELALFEDGKRLTPVHAQIRIAPPSDRSFDTYPAALAHLQGPALDTDADIFWNQGYADVLFDYPIHSADSPFALDMLVAPGLAGRLKMVVRFLPPQGSMLAYEIHGGFGRVALDPRWYQAAWAFVTSGFRHILDGTDHLLFLLCLALPFYRRTWDLLAVVTAFTVAHSVTLISAAYGLVPKGDWFPPLVEVLIAVSIFYMALENIFSASLARRWSITALFGLVHGFGFSFALRQELQFAGDHHLMSLLSFNIGVELGQIVVLMLLIPGLYFLYRYMAERTGLVIISVLAGHTAWHWILDRGGDLRRAAWMAWDTDTPLFAARTLLLVVLGAIVMWWLVRQLRRRSWWPPPVRATAHNGQR